MFPVEIGPVTGSRSNSLRPESAPPAAEIDEAESILRRVVEGLDPEVLEPGSARRLVETFSRMERLAAAGKTLAARRVVSSQSWKLTGERSAAHWMANRTGTSVGNAISVLETAERLAELPATEQAVRSGKLSEVQTKEIASAAAASPAAEKGLLRAVEFEGMAGLKERCQRVRASASDNERDRYESIRRSRYLRYWSDKDGAFRLDGRLTADAGAAFLASMEPYKNQMFAAGRKQGRKDRYEAYAADALVAMAKDAQNVKKEGSGHSAGAPGAVVHIKVDHAALVRGSVEPGEVCEIPGLGPIPVDTARSLANDAFLSAIVTDGVDVRAVAHLGRTIPAHLRTALQNRDPVCVVPGCNERERLEIDHIKPLADNGPTSMENLSRLCSWHHHLKTHHGYRLAGGPGSWSWDPLPDPSAVSSEPLDPPGG